MDAFVGITRRFDDHLLTTNLFVYHETLFCGQQTMNLSITEVLLAIFIYDVFKEGILKKIQAHYGSLLFSFGNKKIQELKSHANETCSEIDDVIINYLAGASQRLDGIVNRDDLSPADQRLHRQFVTQNYQLSILLKKLGVGDQ